MFSTYHVCLLDLSQYNSQSLVFHDSKSPTQPDMIDYTTSGWGFPFQKEEKFYSIRNFIFSSLSALDASEGKLLSAELKESED